MKTFEEYRKDTGYDFSIPIPSAKVVYYAYKGPQVFGPFDTRQEALTHSKIVDSVFDEESKKIRDDCIAAQTKAEQDATAAWYKDLRAEFLIGDEQFTVLMKRMIKHTPMDRMLSTKKCQHYLIFIRQCWMRDE